MAANQSLDTTPPVLKIYGGASLQGEVQISGAKNAALVIIAGALLCAESCRLRNVPQLVDVARMGELLTRLGATFKHQGTVLDVDASQLMETAAPNEIVQQLRASFFVIGPLLARLGVAQVPLPGGCAIGARPVDLHLRGLEAMGAEIEVKQGVVHARIRRARLQGARIHLDCPSVGATETVMMAATLAEGETVIENAAREPEVVDLANFCRAMGAHILGAGTNRIVISGVSKLHSASHRVIPDRIEAGTFLVAAAITQSPLVLTAVNPQDLRAVVEELWAMEAKVFAEAPDRLKIIPGHRPWARILKTRPYPGFPTDLQPQFMALLSQAEGNSLIIESLFENRLQHVAELNRMGADIRVQGNQALIRGVPQLSGTAVMATDLRAAAALVLAALAAEGTTTLHNLHHLDRGYDNLEHKLRRLGAKLERVSLPRELSPPTPLAIAPESACFVGAEVA